MANNTKNTNTNTNDTKVKREHVELPAVTVAKAKGFDIPDKVKRTRTNPLAAALAAANADRNGTYSIKGLTEQKQVDKAIRLLVAAGREAEPACSVRTMYKPEDQTLYFKAVELQTRNRKPKG